MAANFPHVSAILRPIQHFLKTAQEHDSRDPIVAYWCRLYALQIGLKIPNQGLEERKLLIAIMDWLETTKSQMADNESITNEVAAQAYLENYALKLFLYADKQDRASNFGKNVVKAFYTAGIIYDVCQVFSDGLTEEVTQNRKYAKWKASYIHNCLKNGETPVPGPMQTDEGKEFDDHDPEPQPGPSNAPAVLPPVSPQPPPPGPTNFTTTDPFSNVKAPTPPSEPEKPPGGFQPYTGGASVEASDPPVESSRLVNPAGLQLRPEQITKAQKYCRWAESALNYEDLKTSIDNLQKALRLLQTGQDG
uniref:Vta1/callose synthase N-terminal domain-containing protein n=1 Tax=Anopheles dirus TaxID=7168 RepID=A0A182NH60_9DIPT